MNLFTKLDHVGIAVTDIDVVLEVYRQLGLQLTHREQIESQGVDAALLNIGSSHVELLGALDSDTPIGRFLEKRGPGLHHVAYEVDDIEHALSHCRERGIEMIDNEPRVGIGRSLVAFVHPRSLGGVLSELVQHPAEERKSGHN